MKINPALILLSIAFASCNAPRFVYNQSAHNVPVLKQKGDSKLGAYYSNNLIAQTTVNGQELDEVSHGADIQAAYALTDKFAIQGNYFFRNEKNETRYIDLPIEYDSGSVIYKRSLFEAAVGYYKADNKRIMLQLFAGAGFGKVSMNDVSQDVAGNLQNRFFEADVIKIFIQPAHIFRIDKQFVVTFSSRFSYVRFNDIRSNYDSVQRRKYDLEEIKTMPGVFWEPALISSIGFKSLPGLRLECQLGFSKKINSTFLDYRKTNFSVGAFVDLPKLLKGKD